jgi:hypothetical protein
VFSDTSACSCKGCLAVDSSFNFVSDDCLLLLNYGTGTDEQARIISLSAEDMLETTLSQYSNMISARTRFLHGCIEKGLVPRAGLLLRKVSRPTRT